MSITVKDIEAILFKIGFKKKIDNNRNPNYYYEFYQEYPTDEYGNISDDRLLPYNYGSNLYVSFENYDNKFFVYVNSHEYGQDIDINYIQNIEHFLNILDNVVISTKSSFIYNEVGYKHLWDAADSQRERYFNNRLLMKYKPQYDILDIINNQGVNRQETYFDTEFNGKKIMDYSYNELAYIIHTFATKEIDSNTKKGFFSKFLKDLSKWGMDVDTQNLKTE